MPSSRSTGVLNDLDAIAEVIHGQDDTLLLVDSVTGAGGALLLVVPHREGTFDHRRPVTELEHLVADFVALRPYAGADAGEHIGRVGAERSLHGPERCPSRAVDRAPPTRVAETEHMLTAVVE